MITHSNISFIRNSVPGRLIGAVLIMTLATTSLSGLANGATGLIGPADPPPLDRVFIQDGSAHDGIWGRAGGKNYTFSNVDHADNTAVYWGVETQGVKLSLNGALYTGNEIMSYDAGLSDLPGGIAVWSGQTTIVCDTDTEVDCLPENVGKEVTAYTRMQLTFSVNEGVVPCVTCTPVPLVLATDQGLPADVGALVKFANSAAAIDINILFTASESIGGPYEPHLDFFDPRTDITQDGLAHSSLLWGFYWVNTPPALSTNVNNALNENESVTITNSNLAAVDVESGKSDITFTLNPTDSGGVPQEGTLFRDGVALVTHDTFTQQDIDDLLISYTHNGAEDVHDSFTFTVQDEQGELANDGGHTLFQHNFNITLTDDPPVPVAGNGEASLDGVYHGVLQATDADTDPKDLTFSIHEVTPGSVELHDAVAGNFTYTGPDGYYGDALIDFKVSDLSSTVSGTFTVHIPHPDINLVKTVSGPAKKRPDGTFDVEYTITATNSGEDPGTYDLQDTFLPGAGITMMSAQAVYTGGETRTGTLGPYPLFVQDEALAAGESESWKVTARFSIDPLQITPESRDCDFSQPVENTGFYNRVIGFDNESDLSDNHSCTGLPKANINLAKTLSKPARLQPDGSYTVEYTITASNSGVGPGVYDLDDIVVPGAGISLNSATAVYSGGESRTGVLGPYPKFVTNETLVSGGSESWTVTANFAVHPEQTTPETLVCDPGNPVKGTGFFNRVTGVDGEVDLTDNDTCSSPPDPSLTSVDHGDLLIANGDKLILHNMPDNTDWVLSEGGNFTSIFAIAFGGPDQIFALDQANGLIRVDPVFGTQTVVAGSDNFSPDGPGSIAIEDDTHVLVANLVLGGSPALLRVDTSSGGVSVLSPTVLGTTVAMGPDGEIFIGDASKFMGGDSSIIEVNPSDGAQTTVSLGGLLQVPFGLAVEASGDVIVADAGAVLGDVNRILRITPTPVNGASGEAAAGDSQAILSEGGALLNGLRDVTVGANGRIFFTDGSDIIEIHPVTGAQTLVPTQAVVDGPTDIAVVLLSGIFSDSFEGGR